MDDASLDEIQAKILASQSNQRCGGWLDWLERELANKLLLDKVGEGVVVAGAQPDYKYNQAR